jgi:uncharacterized damage-inducible protein DinB
MWLIEVEEMNMIDHYRRWFTYERDVHRTTLESLTRLDESQKASPSFQKAVDLLAHVIAARRMWLFRFGVTAEKVELFPRDVKVETLVASIEQMESDWNQYLSTLSDDDLQRVFEYTSYEGRRFRNSIGDILTQLFGHSSYHRGQIAALVRAMGGEPAVTDFVFWAREAV